MKKKFEEICNRIMKLTNWNRNKALMWCETQNPFFGGTTPKILIKIGRTAKLDMFLTLAEKECGKQEKV